MRASGAAVPGRDTDVVANCPRSLAGRQRISAPAQGGRARGRDCSLFGTVMEGYIMAFAFFWAVRRTLNASESNSALADVRDEVVH